MPLGSCCAVVGTVRPVESVGTVGRQETKIWRDLRGKAPFGYAALEEK